jgi:hypothetical protein
MKPDHTWTPKPDNPMTQPNLKRSAPSGTLRRSSGYTRWLAAGLMAWIGMPVVIKP